MRLLVTTPVKVVIEVDDVAEVRVEDETGAFGIRPRHADFLTCLSVSVLRWRDELQCEHYVALRGGVLRVTDGARVDVATMEAEASDILEDLQGRLVTSFQERDEKDEEERAEANRLHTAAIRQIQHVLRASRETAPSEAIPRLQPASEAERGEI